METNFDNVEKARTSLVERGLSLEIQDKVFTYLRSRTGLALHIQDAMTHRTSITFKSHPLPPNQMGALRFIMEEVVVQVQFHINEEKDRFSVTPSFRYVHPDGGSNGHDFEFILIGSTKDGSFTERSERR